MKKLSIALVAAFLLAGSAVAADIRTAHADFIRAKIAAAEGRFDEAIPLMDAVLASDPANPVLIYERASMLADAGRVEQAVGDLRKLTATNPDFFDAQRLLGRMLLDVSGTDRAKLDEALSHLRAAYTANPDDLATGMSVSQILVSTSRYDDAEKVLAQLLERAPDQKTINYMYAQVLTKLGRGDESKKYLERLVTMDPTFGPAILQLVDIYQKENEFAKAAELLQPLVAQDPLNLDLQRQQALFYLRAGQPDKAKAAFKAIAAADPKDLRAQFYIAEALSDLGQYDEAQKIYRSLLEKTPDDPELLTSYGLSLVSQRKLDEAAKTFRTLLALKDLPPNVAAIAKTQLALVDLEKGNIDEALKTVQPVLVVNDMPNTQAINIALDALRKQKKYAEAITLLRPIEEKYGTDPFVGSRYVEMMIRAGDLQGAKKMAETQVRLGTRNTIAVADAYVQAGQAAGAVDLISQALKNKPDDVDLQFSLGSAYERSGDIPAAEKAFQALLEKHPDHAPTLNYLGYMWAERGVHLQQAAEMLKKAVAAEPHNGAYVDSLGWVYFQSGDLAAAEKYLKEAADLLPRDATVHQHLGDVLAKRGEVGRALSAYRAALKLEPEPKDEEKLRSKIAALEREAQNARR